jgi:O-methyltransferase involved in polyketide biosynthesis
MTLCYRTYFFRHFARQPDLLAEKMISQLGEWPQLFATPIGQYNSFHLGRRAWLIEQALREKISRNEDFIVVNLGCGFDTLFSRLPEGRWRGFNVDFEDVIRARGELSLDDSHVTNVPSSLFDLEWMKQIPTGKPVVFVMTGVLSYLPQSRARHLLKKLRAAFAQGELLCDSCSVLGRWVTNASISVHKQSEAYFKSSFQLGDLMRVYKSSVTISSWDLADTGDLDLSLMTKFFAWFSRMIKLGTLWHVRWEKMQ